MAINQARRDRARQDAARKKAQQAQIKAQEAAGVSSIISNVGQGVEMALASNPYTAVAAPIVRAAFDIGATATDIGMRTSKAGPMDKSGKTGKDLQTAGSALSGIASAAGTVMDAIPESAPGGATDLTPGAGVTGPAAPAASLMPEGAAGGFQVEPEYDPQMNPQLGGKDAYKLDAPSLLLMGPYKSKSRQ